MNNVEKLEALLTDAKNLLKEDEEPSVERRRFLSAFEDACEKFELDVDLEERSKDEVYSEWSDHVNMSAEELRMWSRNPCSRQASLDPEAVLKRNLRLLEKEKEDWTEEDVKDAERTISFISRMRGMKPEKPRMGPHGCPSEWAISLLNWAFNPFDSVPKPSSEVNDDLDPVEEISLAERDNIREADELAEPVWKLKDVLSEFARDFEDYALELESTKSEEDVEQIREELVSTITLFMRRFEEPAERIEEEVQEMEAEKGDGPSGFEFEPVPDRVLYEERGDAVTRATRLGLDGVHECAVLPADEMPEDAGVRMFMAGETLRDWNERVRGLPDAEEMSDTRKASEVFHGDQERMSGSDEGGTESVEVGPVAIHKVENGAAEEVSEDVEKVLGRLWDEE